MGAWFCPCFLFGRLSSRYEALPGDDDGIANAQCCLWTVTSWAGLWWIPQTLRRQAIRERLGIEGDSCNDCLVSTFCGACSLAQMNMEVKSQVGKPLTKQGHELFAYTRDNERMDYDENLPSYKHT